MLSTCAPSPHTILEYRWPLGTATTASNCSPLESQSTTAATATTLLATGGTTRTLQRRRVYAFHNGDQDFVDHLFDTRHQHPARQRSVPRPPRTNGQRTDGRMDGRTNGRTNDERRTNDNKTPTQNDRSKHNNHGEMTTTHEDHRDYHTTPACRKLGRDRKGGHCKKKCL